MKKKLVLMTSALMAIGLLAGCGNQHTHDWGEVTYTWSSDNLTCTAERVCKGDESHKETETANSTYAVVTEAKCETDGKGRYSVSFENEAFAAQTKEVKIDALEHDYKFDSFVWTEFTAQAKYICSHDATHIKFNDATVTSEVTTPAGCETEGVRTYTASFDGHTDTKTETIPATQHSWGEATYVWAADNSSCTATRVCAHDATHKETETKNSVLVPTTPATCETAGVGKYVVEFENSAFAKQEKDNIVIEALGHDYQFVEFVWSEKWDSAQAKYVCSRDVNHVEMYDAKVVIDTNPAACEADGKMTFTASYDGHTDVKESIIPAKGHNLIHVDAKNPDCDEDGNVEHWHCSTCGKNYSDSEGNNELNNIVISALGHKLGIASYEWNSDHTKCTAKATCSVCNEEVSETVDAVEGELESTDCWLYGLVAKFSNEGFESQIYDYYRLTLNDDKTSYTIFKGNHLPSDVVIPSKVNNLPVTEIGYRAFWFTNITSIFIPNTIKVIEQYGISYSHSLITVVFEDNGTLERIESCGIDANYHLKSIVDIPSTLTYIGDYGLSGNKDCNSINYLGTMDQWRAIQKDEDWNRDNPGCGTIHCTDGDVDDHWVDPYQ